MATRRRILVGAGVAAMGATAVAITAEAAASVSKASVGYRDVAYNGEVCGACVWFKPPEAGTTVSHCKLVAGPISPAGWCQAWMKG